MATNARLPYDISLLRMQHKHVTKDLWEGNERLIRPRQHSIWVLKHSDRLDDRVRNLIQHVGFIHTLTLKNIDINHHLLTTLVERWRIETHTFHLPLRETTINFEDVVLQLGLPIDEEPVTSINSGDLLSL